MPRNPSVSRVERIDRGIALLLKEAEPHVPEGHFGDVKIVLTWLVGNEMGMLASWFVHLLRDRQLGHFYIDDRVSGKPQTSSYLLGGWSEKVGKRDVLRAVRSLAAAQGARANGRKRRNGRRTWKVQFHPAVGQSARLKQIVERWYGKLNTSTFVATFAAADDAENATNQAADWGIAGEGGTRARPPRRNGRRARRRNPAPGTLAQFKALRPGDRFEVETETGMSHAYKALQWRSGVLHGESETNGARVSLNEDEVEHGEVNLVAAYAGAPIRRVWAIRPLHGAARPNRRNPPVSRRSLDLLAQWASGGDAVAVVSSHWLAGRPVAPDVVLRAAALLDSYADAEASRLAAQLRRVAGKAR